MYKYLFTFSAFFLLIQTSGAQTEDSLKLGLPAPNSTSFILKDPQEVLQHDNELITVEGCIVKASLKDQLKGKPIFLDMFEAYPDNTLSLAIWEENQPQFLPAADYQQKWVRVTGRAKKKTFTQAGKAPRERVTISLHDPKQITILGDCPVDKK